MFSLAAVLRALPPIAAALLVTGLLAAVVIAAPSGDDPERDRADRKGASGPFAIMRERPTELAPELEEFEEFEAPTPAPPRNADRQLERMKNLRPKREPGPSRAVGLPWKGRLVNGVQLPAEGVAYVTVDSALRTSPSRSWRRWATAATITRTLSVLDAFAAANPGAPRLPVGDLSRPRGGVFDARYGGLGHRSHQNGLDVDIYYPRKDRKPIPPTKPRQVDLKLSQDLVDRLVAAGAELVFVGPSLKLRGPKAIVKPLVHHDNHVHVRWPRR